MCQRDRQVSYGIHKYLAIRVNAANLEVVEPVETSGNLYIRISGSFFYYYEK